MHCRRNFGRPEDAPFSYDDLVASIHPEDRERQHNAVGAAIAASSGFNVEYRLVTSQDEIRWTQIQARYETGDRPRFVGVSMDITERKRAEAALRESGDRFRMMANNISQLAWTCDHLGAVTWYNKRWLDYTGLSFEDMRGWGWDRVQHPDHVDRVVATVQRSAETGEPWEDTFPLRAVDGVYRWFFSQARPIRDERGAVVQWFGTNTDVTEQRKADLTLQDAEARQAFLLKLSDALRPLVDPVQIEGEACRLLGEQLGVDRAYYVGIDEQAGVAHIAHDYVRDGSISLAGDHPIADFRWSVDILRRGECHVVADTQQSPLVPLGDRAALAASQIIACAGAPSIKQGKLLGALCVTAVRPRVWPEHEVELLREVAARIWDAVERASAEAALRESEKMRRLAFEGSRMGAWQWDLRSGLTLGDATYMALYGLEPNDHWFDGQAVLDVLSAESLAQAAEVIGGEHEPGKEFEGEFDVGSGPAAGRWLRWRARAEADRPWVLTGVLFDITERKDAEAALRDSEARLQVALAAADLGTFVWHVAEDRTEEDARARAHFGLPPDGSMTLAQALVTTFHPDDGPRYTAAVACSIDPAGPGTLHEELRIRRPDGGERWMAVNAKTIFEGEPRAAVRLVGALADVTEQKQQEERQAFLLRLSDSLRAETGVDAVGYRATQMIAEQLGADRVYLVTLNPHDDEVVVTQESRRKDMPPLQGSYRSSDFPSAIKEIFERTIVYSDVRTDPRLTDQERSAFAGLGAVGFIAASIRRGGEAMIWAAGALSTEPRRWTPSQIALFQDAVERTWAAVERARIEATLRESEQELATDLAGTSLLRDLAERLVTEENVQTIYEGILMAAVSIMNSDAGTVQIYDPETKSLVLLAATGFEWTMTDHFHRVGAESSTACGIALNTGERTVLEFDDKTDEAGAMHVAAGYRSAQATPLLGRAGAPLGMLNTHWRESGHRPNDRQLHFLDLLARQAADLFEHRAAEKSLRDSEERLRQFGEASQDVLWIRDAETLQWIYLTPAFEAIYGITCEEALFGNNYRGWLDLIVPDDRQHASDSIGRVRDGEHVTFDFRIKRPVDGAIRWMRNTDFPIVDEGGNVTLIGGIGHDATELREAELRLQTLVEGIPQLVWRAVGHGLWTWVSAQWTAYTGQSGADSEGNGWLEAVHAHDRASALDAWSHALEDGGFEVECRLRHAAKNTYRWFQTRATPVRDETGATVEWLGASTDIHELRELQERQQVLVAELQHRTRNLMGVVRSTADKTARASADIADFRARFRVRLESLARVQGLLSRMNEHDRVSFDELIRSELSVVESGEDRVILHGPTGVRLRSSTVQTLAMALHELVTNAVKYGALGDGGGALAVTWSIERPGEDGLPWLHIDWRESGVVMPEQDAAPTGTGQGRELIERALPYQLEARTTYALGPDGVHCTISVPVSASMGAERLYDA